MTRVVLVTGVADDFAARCARALQSEPATRVIGIDVTPPRRPIEGVEFVRADVGSPRLAALLTQHRVDTVVHLAHTRRSGGRGRRAGVSAKEQTVIASMQLLASCQRSPEVTSLVLLSTAQVYGSTPRDPALFTEAAPLPSGSRTGLARDCLEVESYARGLGRRRDDVAVTVLRLATLLGAGVHNPLTRYLEAAVVPRAAGFDARLQLLHPADGARAVTTAVDRRRAGTYNVAAPDVLVLGQLLGWLARPAVPLPRPVLRALRSRPGFGLPEDLDGLTWGRVMDVSLVEAELGFATHWTSRQAAEEWVALSRPGALRRLGDPRPVATDHGG